MAVSGLIVVLLGVLGWIVVKDLRRAKAEPSEDTAPYKMFGRDFRIAVGVPALLAAVILLLWSLDQESWKVGLPIFLVLVAGASLLPHAVAVWCRRVLFLVTAALMVWAAARYCSRTDYIGMAIGAALGTIGGLGGGFAGGFISRRLSPAARLAAPGDRAGISMQGGRNGLGLGVISGVVMGAVVGLLDQHAGLHTWLLATWIYGEGIAQWLESSAEESIDGLPGSMIGGGCGGVLAGHVAKLLVASLP